VVSGNLAGVSDNSKLFHQVLMLAQHSGGDHARGQWEWERLIQIRTTSHYIYHLLVAST
jgi:hypothetical protein